MQFCHNLSKWRVISVYLLPFLHLGTVFNLNPETYLFSLPINYSMTNLWGSVADLSTYRHLCLLINFYQMDLLLPQYGNVLPFRFLNLPFLSTKSISDKSNRVSVCTYLPSVWHCVHFTMWIRVTGNRCPCAFLIISHFWWKYRKLKNDKCTWYRIPYIRICFTFSVLQEMLTFTFSTHQCGSIMCLISGRNLDLVKRNVDSMLSLLRIYLFIYLEG